MTDHRRDLVNACVDLIPGVNREMQTKYVEALMELCDRADPSCVIDVGSNYGVSCLAMASAMALQGKGMDAVTTIDIHRGLWMRTLSKWDNWFANFGVDTRAITAIESDFKELAAPDFVKGERMMIFFDIHDHDDGSSVANSPIFVKDWLPLIDKGIVAAHDMNPCDKDWERPRHWGTVPSAAVVEGLNGQWYRGFGEVRTFIEYLNGHNVAPTSIPGTSLIWFEMEGGKPK